MAEVAAVNHSESYCNATAINTSMCTPPGFMSFLKCIQIPKFDVHVPRAGREDFIAGRHRPYPSLNQTIDNIELVPVKIERFGKIVNSLQISRSQRQI